MIETKEEEKIIRNYIIKKNKEEIKRKDKKKKEKKRSKWVHKEYMNRLNFRETRVIFLLNKTGLKQK